MDSAFFLSFSPLYGEWGGQGVFTVKVVNKQCQFFVRPTYNIIVNILKHVVSRGLVVRLVHYPSNNTKVIVRNLTVV